MAEVVGLDAYSVNDDIRRLPGTYWRLNEKGQGVIVSVVIKDNTITVYELSNGQIQIPAELNLQHSRLRLNSVKYGIYTPISASATIRSDEINLEGNALTFKRTWYFYDRIVGGSPATTPADSTQESGFVATRISQFPLSFNQLLDFSRDTSEQNVRDLIVARENRRSLGSNVVTFSRRRQCESDLK